MSFLKSAISRGSKELAAFVNEAEKGNSIRYTCKGGVTDTIIFPYSVVNVDGTDVKQLYNITAYIHHGLSVDGKYKPYMCMEDIIDKSEDGKFIHDGTCPYCEMVNKAWEIAKLRIDQEVEQLDLRPGTEAYEEKVKEIKRNCYAEMKIKERSAVIYQLIAVLEYNKSGELVINDVTKLPSYQLKIWKMSASLADKLNKGIVNSGVEIAGSAVKVAYPDNKDTRTITTQATISPQFAGAPNNPLTKYPGLLESINKAAADFKFDNIDRDFVEFKDVSTDDARVSMQLLFEKYDKYLDEKRTNPNAKYLEDTVATSKPSLSDSQNEIGALDGGIDDIEGFEGADPNKMFGSGMKVEI